ncbi:ADP-ribosylglycohydrolase family protein [Desulfobacter sp.]|uniref:ADP-ribosylglycohydrolase family protein n=1 Tax=Desulfobacter sp. TaxID=2294 RepID=UPI00257FAD51|nr:ADP-ribosylglycohydrolase family protein [Desulfobacter sp.]
MKQIDNHMMTELTYIDRAAGAMYGLFIGDALAMPVHWYYNTKALEKDYGHVKDFMKPRNPHPDSILWRSSYNPPKKSADILHDQSKYWGQRGIHYHQFLKAGENTLNLKLAGELLLLIKGQKRYSENEWLNRLVEYMTTPGLHNDTYIEEYFRHFFTQYAQGCDLTECGRKDENHIGGLSLMLPILLVFGQDRDYAQKTALSHLALTHDGPSMISGANIIAKIVLDVLNGTRLKDAIVAHFLNGTDGKSKLSFESLLEFPDGSVVGKHFSSACYMEHSIPATLYLAYKYAGKPEQGLIANTMCGGDNAGRGAVLGALLGAEGGFSCWPERWVSGLLNPPEIISMEMLG